MLKRFKGNRNYSLGADLRSAGFKKAVWLYEVRKQTLTLPEIRTEIAEKFRTLQ